jgi:hypothetical protein
MHKKHSMALNLNFVDNEGVEAAEEAVETDQPSRPRAGGPGSPGEIESPFRIRNNQRHLRKAKVSDDETPPAEANDSTQNSRPHPGLTQPRGLKSTPAAAPPRAGEVYSRYGGLEEEPNLGEFPDNLLTKYTFDGSKKPKNTKTQVPLCPNQIEPSRSETRESQDGLMSSSFGDKDKGIRVVG